MFEKNSKYLTYILRIWQEQPDKNGNAIWRYTLIDPITTKRIGFTTLEGLSEYLQKEMSRNSS